MARAPEHEQPRLKKKLKEVEDQIERQQHIVDNPEDAKERTAKSIDAAKERERPTKNQPTTTTKFINHPPATVPTYFQNRFTETDILTEFLRDDRHRIMHLIGRAGIGKTAVTVRLLKALEGGTLPDDNGHMSVDGIVYLSAIGRRDINVANLYSDLLKLLPDEVANDLQTLYRDPQTPTDDKLQALAKHFPPDTRVALLLDNFESVLDDDGNLTDNELDTALKALLDAPPHGLRLIITTRRLASSFYLHQTQRQRKYVIGQGLESPFAEDMLRQMDDGTLGLKDADPDTLTEAAEKVRRYPRALEALVGWLEADETTSLTDVMAFADKQLPDNVVKALVGQAFNRLDETAQQVMQALAIFARPVQPGAVDYLLQPFIPTIDSATVLKRLVNWHMIRQEGGTYTLHPVDREYALELVPRGEHSNRHKNNAEYRNFSNADSDDPLAILEELLRQVETESENSTDETPFTQIALYDRAADYFKQTRTQRDEWETLDDLQPQLDEFDMRCQAGDYDTAADVLTDISFDYLLRWGHYRLMLRLHLQLQGKIEDKTLNRISLGNLGNCYSDLGQIDTAIDYHQQALQISRDIGHKQNEGSDLGNLGNAYYQMGQIDTAIDYYQQALQISRDIGDKQGESINLGNLGNAYSDLGQIDTAIDYYQQALHISRDIGDRPGERVDLGNLGLCYYQQGDYTKALRHTQNALQIARDIGYPSGESINLNSLGTIYLAQNKKEDVRQVCREAITIADEIGFRQTQSEARTTLALACLYSHNFPEARQVIAEALTYDYPTNNHNAHLIEGIIALRQSNHDHARTAFEQAISAADTILKRTAAFFEAQDAKALALCGTGTLRRNAGARAAGYRLIPRGTPDHRQSERAYRICTTPVRCTRSR